MSFMHPLGAYKCELIAVGKIKCKSDHEGWLYALV